MKPLNLDNNPCSAISSNCVIWQGPDIPCIKLCTGDTITDVIYQLALELCTIVDQVNISTLDLSCLKITTGAPTNINELLQILINKICTTNNIPATPQGFTIGNCPSTCIVDVAECLRVNGQTTMKLADYVQLIGNRICSLVSQISTINNSITNLTTRVEVLESIEPPVPYVLPKFAPDCPLSASVQPGITYGLDVILQALVNDDFYGYCALVSQTGLPSDIETAYSSQTVTGTDASLSNCSLTIQQLFSTTWINNPDNLSESFIDLWLTVKDIRDAYKRYNVTAGNSNVTVTTTTTPGSCGPEVSFAVKAKSSSVSAGTNIVSVVPTTTGDNTDYVVNAKNTTVVAGDNVTVTPNTTDPANTIYTVTAKEAIVTPSTDTTNTVTVTPSTSGNDTTYTVYSKYGLDTFVMGWSMEKDRFCPWMDIPSVTQDSTAGSGCATNYTSTGYSIPEAGGGYKMIKPNIIQTTASVGTYANKNISTTNLALNSYITTSTFNTYGCTFGTLNSDQGTFTITQSGVYIITAYCHLKSVCSYTNAGSEGKFFWSANPGHVGIGIVNRANTTDIYCGNFQTIVPNKTTQIDLTTSRTVYLGSGTILGVNILNVTDRTYTPNQLDGGDGIGLQVVKLSEDFTTI